MFSNNSSHQTDVYFQHLKKMLKSSTKLKLRMMKTIKMMNAAIFKTVLNLLTIFELKIHRIHLKHEQAFKKAAT